MPQRPPATAPPAAGQSPRRKAWKPGATKNIVAAPQWRVVNPTAKPPNMMERINTNMNVSIARRTEAQTHMKPIAFGSSTSRISMRPPRYANDMPVGGSAWANGAVHGVVNTGNSPLWGRVDPGPMSEVTSPAHGNAMAGVAWASWDLTMHVPRIPPAITDEQKGITNSENVETYDLVSAYHQTKDHLFSDPAGEPFEAPAYQRLAAGSSGFKSLVPRLPERKIDDLTCVRPPASVTKPKSQRKDLPTPSAPKFSDWPIGAPWTHPFQAGVRNPNAPKKKKVKPAPPLHDKPWERFNNIPGPGEPGHRSVDSIESQRRQWNYIGVFRGKAGGSCISSLGRDSQAIGHQHDASCQHLGPGQYGVADAPIAGRGTLYGNIDFWNKSPGEKKSSSFTSGVMRMTMPKNVSVGRGGRELGPFSYGDAWGRYDVAYVRDTGKFRRP